jgi:Domain of unknown function (DUF4270)
LAVDNITTFEQYLEIETDNLLFNDTNRVVSDDYLAIGYTNDPEFGQTQAKGYFDIGMSNYMINPFTHKDSVIAIDSVVLSLSYNSYYGDTNSSQTLRVYELAQSSAFQDTTTFKYNQPDFLTTGPQLGSKTFQVKTLKDSILHIRGTDTTKIVNAIRIRLDNSIGERFKLYDTSNTANGAFRSDSAFKKLFKGFAIVPDNAGNALSYIDASDVSKTALIVYFRGKNGSGIIDTTSTSFGHYGARLPYTSRPTVFSVGQANIVQRTPGGNYLSYLNNGLPLDDRIFLQSSLGSYARLTIPALDTFKNAVIHKAEIIATPIASAQENIFSYPTALLLDNVNTAMDTAFTFDNDMGIALSSATSFTYAFSSFGGLIKSDSTFRFNIARYVQSIVTKKTPNRKLRLYAPVRAFLYSPANSVTGRMFINDRVAHGRIAIAGGNYVDASKRLRMRIVYSKL